MSDTGTWVFVTRRESSGPDALGSQFFHRTLRFLQPFQIHRAQHFVGLRELHVSVVDDLDQIAPRIMEVEAAAERRDAQLLQPRSHGFLVVDDQAEMALAVGRLRSARGERDELVAHVDERHAPSAASQLEIPEDRPPEFQHLIEVAHLERDVIHSDELRHDLSVVAGTLARPAV
jgi:hypothetical protein